MAPTDRGELSEREREILRLVATGASNKEIAQQLFISSNTVKVHLRNIFNKIGTASRTEAAMYAVRIGLVEARPGQSFFEGAAQVGIQPEDIAISETLQEATPLPAEAPKIEASRRWIYGLLVIFLLSIIGIGVWLGRGSATTAPATTTPTIPQATATSIPRWQEQTAMPTARSKLAVAAFENQVYAIGGETTAGVTGIVERFDPASNTWISLADKPTAVSEINAAVIGGDIYVPGGRLSSGQPSNVLEVYNPRIDHWEQRAWLPVAVSGYALAAYEGRLYLFGGWDGQSYLNTVFEYDPTMDRWQARTPMPTRRAYCGAAIASGLIYVIGGFDGNEALTTSEAYLPVLDDSGEDPWKSAPSLPEGRYNLGVAGVADLIYIIGGRGAENKPMPLLEFSPSIGKWQAVSNPIPEIWESLGIVPIGPYFYLLGGLINNNPTNVNLAYQAIYTIVIPILP